MQSVHQGACHCGRIKFELRGQIGAVMACNCSLCRMKGALWHGTDEAHLSIAAAEEDLLLYQFGTMTAKHYSCRHCGVSPFSRPRIAPQGWVVNVRCIQALDIARLKVHEFDGQNWEDSARKFIQGRGAADA